LAVKAGTLRDAAAVEEVNTRQLLPKFGAKLYHLPFSFFVLPWVATALMARHFGASPLDWRAGAIGACAGTVTFALFRQVTFPHLFRQAVQRRNRP
jgi:hypothetical protein